MGVYTLLPIIAGMGATAGLAVIAVLIGRCFLKKGPKLFCYLLWSVVLFRLLCPVSIPSAVSALRLFEFGQKRISFAAVSEVLKKGCLELPESLRLPQNLDAAREEELRGNFFFNDFMGGANDLWLAWNGRFGAKYYQTEEKSIQKMDGADILPVPPALFMEMGISSEGEEYVEAKNMEKYGKYVPVWLAATTWIWIAGIVGMLLYSLFCLLRLRRQLVGVVLLKENIYQSDYIASPFVIGIFFPKIYLPSALYGKEQEYILLHEQTHIKRGDHIFRLLAFAALVLHWFNPLIWLAFYLSGKDMEMACDEAVMRGMKEDIRAEYSASLLGLAIGRHLIPGTYLAFGEGDVKGRIKNIMHYKKPTVFWIVFAVLFVSGTVCAFGSDPKMEESGEVLGIAIKAIQNGIQFPEEIEENKDFLTLYSLTDSELVQRLVEEFSLRHPEIEIRWETGEEKAFIPEQIDALTAKLTAGMGPDLLILDGLPAELYQSKGLLTDLTPALKTVRQELQQNILSAYTQDEKVFMLPVHYMVPAVLVDNQGQDAVRSLYSLMQHHLKAEFSHKVYLENYSRSDLLELTYYNYTPDFIGEDGSVDETELSSFLLFTKWLGDWGEIPEGEYVHPYFTAAANLKDFADKSFGIMFLPLRSVEDLYDSFAQAENMAARGIKLQAVDEVFFPEGLLGINAWSQKKDLANQFIQTVFSSEMQSDYVDVPGFSVNAKVFAQEFENLEKNRENDQVYIAKNREDMEQIVRSCKSRIADASILQILQEESVDYFSGKIILNDCVEAIIERLP